jgi:hypothetical protein
MPYTAADSRDELAGSKLDESDLGAVVVAGHEEISTTSAT